MPIPSADGGGWQSTGASSWVYRYGNHGTSAGWWWFSGQPSLLTNSSSSPSSPEHLRSDPVRPSSTKHGLDEAWSSEEPLWICLAPKMQLTVARVLYISYFTESCRGPSQYKDIVILLYDHIIIIMRITIPLSWGFVIATETSNFILDFPLPTNLNNRSQSYNRAITRASIL